MRADAIFGAIGRFAVKFRWLMVVVWLAGAFAAATGLPSLSSVAQGNNSAFLPASAPSEHAADLAAPFGANNLVPVPVVVASPGGSLDQSWITGLQAQLARAKTVVVVHDLGRSANGHAEQLQVLSKVGQNDEGGQKTLIKDLRSVIASAHAPAGTQVHLTGQVAINVDQQAKSGSTGNQVEFASIIFVLVLLVLIFRSLLAPLITLFPAILAVVISGPLIAEASHAGLKVSFLAQILLVVLLIGAGTDYGLFLVFRVRENLRAGMGSREAVVAGLTRVGESITFSAATVIAALLSLLFASFQIYSNLGIPLAIGIAVMLLAGLTLLPALLAIFGRAAFWPTKNRAGATATGVWGRAAGRIVRRPVIALVIGLVAFGALAVGVTGYKAGGFGGTISAPAGTDSAAGTTLLNKYFPTSAANPTNLIYKLSAPAWQDPGPAANAEQQIASSPLFTRVTGPLDPVAGVRLTQAQYTQLHNQLGPARALPAVPPPGTKVPAPAYQAYRATAQYVSPDGKTIQFQTSLTAGDPSTTAAMNAVPSIRTFAGNVAHSIGASDYGVGGQAPGVADVSAISNNDLAKVIPIAILVIGLLLALVMRSLVAPLYLIASVAISYFAALGLAVLVFIKLGNSGGISFILPFLLFIFLLALGEDYNILVMSRIREEAHRISLKDAVSRAVGITGTTVTSAGLVLAGTFAVFAIVGSSSPGGSQFRDVGLGLAFGVLMDTFVVRTVLVPCTAVLLGRWNWWPAKLSRTAVADDDGHGPGGGRGPGDGGADWPGPGNGHGSASRRGVHARTGR